MDLEKIVYDFHEYIVNENRNIFGIEIYHDNKIYSKITNNDRTCVYSIGKTITAIAICICKEMGLLSFEDKIISFFTGFSYSEGTEELTIQNLLDMCARKDISWVYDENGELYSDRDFAQLFLDVDVTLDKGMFKYSNSCSYTLGRIVEKVSGLVLLDFCNIYFFRKLDIISPRWNTDNFGHTICANGLFLNTKELSTIGQMILNNGVYNNEKIFDANNLIVENYNVFPEKLKNSPSIFGDGYKNNMWVSLNPLAYRMEGIYSNYVIILKNLNVSIAITGDEKIKRDHMELSFLLEKFN